MKIKSNRQTGCAEFCSDVILNDLKEKMFPVKQKRPRIKYTPKPFLTIKLE